MLNRCYYLNNDDVSCDTRTAAEAGITVVQPAGIQRLLDRQYSAEGNFSFCLGLQGNGQELLAQAQQNLLLFFHPFYEIAGHGKPLFLFASRQEVESVRVPLTKLFWQQRLTVELVVVDESDEHTDAEKGVIELNAQTDNPNPAYTYYQYCLSAYCAEDIVLLKGAEMGPLVNDLRMVEDELRQQHADFYELADRGQQMRGAIATLSHENDLYHEENAILQELLELAGHHDEVNHILRFYKNEYEILPLWYKRFGHIIKVLQGKRSFRSLYDKRVKKYKD